MYKIVTRHANPNCMFLSGRIKPPPQHDQFLTNRPDLFIVQSLVKTKHKALIINSKLDCAKAVQRPQRTIVKLLEYTPVVCYYLCQALSKYNWSGITEVIDCGNNDIDANYDDFIKIIK